MEEKLAFAEVFSFSMRSLLRRIKGSVMGQIKAATSTNSQALRLLLAVLRSLRKALSTTAKVRVKIVAYAMAIGLWVNVDDLDCPIGKEDVYMTCV